jgi:hypothetical protein
MPHSAKLIIKNMITAIFRVGILIPTLGYELQLINRIKILFNYQRKALETSISRAFIYIKK